MNSEQKIEWFNERDPLNEWKLNDDVFCLHCDGVFKAQDVAQLNQDWPTCPVCRTSSPLDFSNMPWWRGDLVRDLPSKYETRHSWIGKPIEAVAGQPGRLPKES